MPDDNKQVAKEQEERPDCPSEPTPFDKFTNVARKVMQTPKSEIDKPQEEEKD